MGREEALVILWGDVTRIPLCPVSVEAVFEVSALV